jgi:hypothetical protein
MTHQHGALRLEQLALERLDVRRVDVLPWVRRQPRGARRVAQRRGGTGRAAATASGELAAVDPLAPGLESKATSENGPTKRQASADCVCS